MPGARRDQGKRGRGDAKPGISGAGREGGGQGRQDRRGEKGAGGAETRNGHFAPVPAVRAWVRARDRLLRCQPVAAGEGD